MSSAISDKSLIVISFKMQYFAGHSKTWIYESIRSQHIFAIQLSFLN
jgi:hypothetical protein